MDCKKIEEVILTDYVDGRLEGRALKDFEAHLASCSKCRAFASEIAGISTEFRKAGHMAPPAAVWERIRTVVAEEPVEVIPGRNIFEPIRLFFDKARPVLVAATAAMLILAVLITARIVSNRGAISQEDEIFSMVDLGENANGFDYDLGTPAESYFL